MAGQKMIASSALTAAKSRIAQERVSRNSGRAPGPRRRRWAMQRLLCGLVQSLFHHVDNHDGGAFGFQSDKKGNQGLRGRSTVFNEPSQGLDRPWT